MPSARIRMAARFSAVEAPSSSRAVGISAGFSVVGCTWRLRAAYRRICRRSIVPAAGPKLRARAPRKERVWHGPEGRLLTPNDYDRACRGADVAVVGE